jgi:phosphoribosylglycinamide formyltransferase-1
MVALAKACAEGGIPAGVALVISNDPRAAGLEKARALGLETQVIDHRSSQTREEHDRKLHTALESKSVDLVCLAGYMRILSAWFVKEWRGKVVNIHPSLLPAFPGLDVQQKAIDYGVRLSGCTVHFVDERVDHGPIIVQTAVPVLDRDTSEALAARILEQEHIAYVEAVRLFFEGRLRIDGRRVLIEGSDAGS